MASVAEFQIRFPEFSDSTDERIQMFLDDVALIMGTPARWLGYYDTAQQYYAAHFLVVSEATESGDTSVLAPLHKQEVDDVLIESQKMSVEINFDELNGTSYGKRVLFYRKICFTGMYGV